MHRKRHPGSGGDIPVIYITAPPAATAKMIAVEFARFLGLPVARRLNITDITEAVCGVCLDARTSLVCVDEIHNLNLATRAGAEVSDQLKYFSERLPATFVYAGIDVARGGLFTGTRGAQIASRFATITTIGFANGSREQRRDWQALIATLEATLRLRRHRPGTLVDLADYLHQRTAAMIGSLSHLIRGAAIDAIVTGQEEITRAGLDAVKLDHAAEHHHPAATTRTGRGSRRAGAGVA
jgi:hypothetical protein